MPRRSKVEALPAPLRAELERLLTDRTHGGYLALAAWLKAQGYEISHAAVHRHDQRIQRTMNAIRASAEAARLLAQAAPDEADEHSAAVIRLVQSSLFDAMLKVREAEDTDPAKQVQLLAAAARAVADASRASIGQKRWADTVKSRLEDLERSAAKSGRRLDAETLTAIREGLYGDGWFPAV